jgi:hypothetical protein
VCESLCGDGDGKEIWVGIFEEGRKEKEK